MFPRASERKENRIDVNRNSNVFLGILMHPKDGEDRYLEGIFLDQRSRLSLNSNLAYTESDEFGLFK